MEAAGIEPRKVPSASRHNKSTRTLTRFADPFPQGPASRRTIAPRRCSCVHDRSARTGSRLLHWGHQHGAYIRHLVGSANGQGAVAAEFGNFFRPFGDALAVSDGAGSDWHRIEAPWSSGFPSRHVVLRSDARGDLFALWQESRRLWVAMRPVNAATWQGASLLSETARLFSGRLAVGEGGDALAVWEEQQGTTVGAIRTASSDSWGRPEAIATGRILTLAVGRGATRSFSSTRPRTSVRGFVQLHRLGSQRSGLPRRRNQFRARRSTLMQPETRSRSGPRISPRPDPGSSRPCETDGGGGKVLVASRRTSLGLRSAAPAVPLRSGTSRNLVATEYTQRFVCPVRIVGPLQSSWTLVRAGGHRRSGLTLGAVHLLFGNGADWSGAQAH
jgi:hypothetical protein